MLVSGHLKRVIMQGTYNEQNGAATGATAIGNGVAVYCTEGSGGAFAVLTMQLDGISGDIITFEANQGGPITDWDAIYAEKLNASSTTIATTATADGLYRIVVAGIYQVRARISTRSAGTIFIVGWLAA